MYCSFKERYKAIMLQINTGRSVFCRGMQFEIFIMFSVLRVAYTVNTSYTRLNKRICTHYNNWTAIAKKWSFKALYAL